VLVGQYNVERVFHMADFDRAVRHHNSNNIKAIALVPTSVSSYPHSGRTTQFAPFAPVDGLHGVAEIGTGSCLDLDEGHRSFPFGDQIHVPMPVAEASLQHAPSVLHEPTLSDTLAEFAKALVVVSGGSRSGHAKSVQHPRVKSVTRELRGESFSREARITAEAKGTPRQ
jgi:hypothetical protein